MEERLVGDGDWSLDVPKRAFSVLKREDTAGSRPCQTSLGEEFPSEALKGDDWNGDESVLSINFWLKFVSFQSCMEELKALEGIAYLR